MDEYIVVFEHEVDGGYSVYVPDLPGCASQGDTYDEALANIREAIACHLEAMSIEGIKPPVPHAQVTTVRIPKVA